VNKSYEMYQDADGYLRANFFVSPENRDLIGLFLETDIGGDASHCNELINETQGALQGQNIILEDIGNLFIVTITSEKVQIENLYDEGRRIELSCQEFLDILTDWLALTKH
jgi:hypothetical protein